MRLHCFLTVNSLVNAAGDHLACGSFMENALNYLKTFPRSYVISLCGVVVTASGRCSVRVLLKSFFFLLSFFPFFCVVVFYKYIPK